MTRGLRLDQYHEKTTSVKLPRDTRGLFQNIRVLYYKKISLGTSGELGEEEWLRILLSDTKSIVFDVCPRERDSGKVGNGGEWFFGRDGIKTVIIPIKNELNVQRRVYHREGPTEDEMDETIQVSLTNSS